MSEKVASDAFCMGWVSVMNHYTEKQSATWRIEPQTTALMIR